jgi:rhodanese-related sulfurtransferase
MRRNIWLVFVVVAVLLAPMGACLAQQEEAPRIDKDALKGMLGDAKLVLIDVRTPKDWAAGDNKIKGAVHQDPNKVAQWGKILPKDKQFVLYCA